MCAFVCMLHEARYGILKKSISLIKAYVSHDWLKGQFAPGPHNEVSITATTKEMFF